MIIKTAYISKEDSRKKGHLRTVQTNKFTAHICTLQKQTSFLMCVLFNRKYTNQLFECMEENYLNLLKTSPNLMNLIHSTTTFGMPPRKSKKLSGRLWPSNLFTFFFCFFLMNFIFSSQEHVSPILSPLVKNQTKI